MARCFSIAWQGENVVQKAPLLMMAWNNDAKRPMACGGVGQLGAAVVGPYHQGVGQSQYKDWQGRRPGLPWWSWSLT